MGCTLVACLLGAPVAAHAAVSFTSAPYPLPAGGTEYQSRIGAVALSDLNNDGRPDILVYRGGNGSVYVLLNQGGGTFAAPQTYAACENHDNGGTMVAGQFNAGSAADVILGCDAGTGQDLLLGNGDGTLGSAAHGGIVSFLNNELTLWGGDPGDYPVLLNGVYNSVDQRVDLCVQQVTSLASGGCPPDASDSSGGDPSGHAGIGQTLTSARFYDVPNCPRDDLILTPYQRGFRTWGQNPFAGASIAACESLSYTERAVQGIPDGENLIGIAAGDISGDGTPDLVMPTSGSSLITLVWQNNATDLGGGFPPGQQSVLTASIPSIEDQHIADFDGDGVGDVAVVGESTGAPTATLAIHRGHGDGSFDSPPVTFPVPGGSPDGFNTIGPNHLAVGDLNADGKPDVVSIAQGDGSVTVLLNGSVPPVTTPPPGGTTGPPAADTVVPVISGFKLGSRTFRVGRGATAIAAAVPRGTTIRYTLSEAAKVTVVISRKAAGRRKGRRCVAPTRKLLRAKRCTRYRGEGALTRTGARGPGSIAFSGRIGRRALKIGTHRMTLSAKDAAGNRSKRLVATFRIVR
jgi:hypothetical protein